MTVTSNQGVQQRLDTIRATIDRYNHAYYILDQPAATDDEYDALMNELRELEGERLCDLLLGDRPGHRSTSSVSAASTTCLAIGPAVSCEAEIGPMP